MIQAIIGPLSGLIGTWLNGKVETKAAEVKDNGPRLTG